MDNKYTGLKDVLIDKLLNAVAFVIAFLLAIPKRFKRFVHKLKRLDVKVIVMTSVAYISIVVLTLFTVFYIKDILSHDIQIIAYIDGVNIGIVGNTYTLEGSRIKVENEIINYTGEQYTFEHEIKYGFIVTDDTDCLTKYECYAFLNDISSMGIIDMYSLYIDDIYVGSVLERTDIEIILEQCRNVKLKEISSIDSSVVDIKLHSSAEIITERRMKTELSEYGEIYSRLINKKNVPELKYISIKHEVFTEVIKCEVEYHPSDTMYIGVENQAREGSDGINELIYEVQYFDGKKIYESLISDRMIIELEPSIILQGTKQPPPAESTGVFIWPLEVLEGEEVIITSYFEEQRVEFDGDEYHYGIDIAADENTYVYAADGGYVDFSTDISSYGNFIRILHNNGLSTYYAHMSELLVDAGEYVYPGQIIGKVGMTGVATAPHLHFEIREDFHPVDPLEYLP